MSLGRESLSTRKLFTLPPMAAHLDRNQSLNEWAKIRVVNCIVPSTPNFWSIAWLLTYEWTNRNRSIHVVVCKLYWETVDIMKNNGLKIPEKDQIYVLSRIFIPYRAKIIGESFSILCLNVSLLMRGLARSIRNFQRKQWMYITGIFLKTPLSIYMYFNFFQIFFQNLSSQTCGAAYLRVRLIHRSLR